MFAETKINKSGQSRDKTERKMKDQYNREIDYIRISVTDRCNLRCKYCMPECGVADLGHSNILTFDEITAVVEACSSLGIKNVKLTGGEPLVRRGITGLVKQLKAVKGIETVTLTTNGIMLKDMLPELVAAGIDSINISLDTLDRAKFEEITGYDKLSEVLETIEACKAYCGSQALPPASVQVISPASQQSSPQTSAQAPKSGGFSLKINTVTLAHCNEDEIIDFARLAKSSKIDVRFIEMMPLGLGKDFEGYSQEFIMDKLEAEFGKLIPLPQEDKHGNGPAAYYRPEGFAGTIGFISAVSHQFCDHCNRIRLTAEGVLKPCLQYSTGIDLKSILRSRSDNAADNDSSAADSSQSHHDSDEASANQLTEKLTEKLTAAIKKGIYEKPKSHQFSSTTIADGEDKFMSKIGG